MAPHLKESTIQNIIVFNYSFLIFLNLICILLKKAENFRIELNVFAILSMNFLLIPAKFEFYQKLSI